jgi:hypothetical protein
MEYTKPEIVCLAPALAAVQQGKALPMHDTNIPSRTTVAAYEEDE